MASNCLFLFLFCLNPLLWSSPKVEEDGDDWKNQLAALFSNPTVLVIDQPEAIERLPDRVTILEAFEALKSAPKEETVCVSKQVVVVFEERIAGELVKEKRLRRLIRSCPQICSCFGVLKPAFPTPAASTGRPPPTEPGLRYVASETTRLKNSFVEASERRRTRDHSVIVSFLDLQMLGFVNWTSKGPYIQFSGKLQFGNEYKLSRVESFEVSGEFVDANLEVAISNSMIDRKSLNDDCDLVFSEHNCYDDSSQYSSAFSELQLEVLSNVFSVWSDSGSEFSERSSSHKKPKCGSDVQDGVKISSDVDEADAVTFSELVYGWHYKVFFVGSTLFALQQLFGIVNISGSVIAMILMDKLGRRVLLLGSFTGMTLSMGLQATAASSLVSSSGVMYLSVGDNYLQLFAHFFDEKWKLKEWVLKFCSVYSFAVVGCSVPVFLPEDSTISKVSINLVITRCFGPMILLEHLSVSEYFGDSSVGHLENNEGDPELLIFIPFTSDVKIKSISIVGGADGTSPSKMRAFINQEGIDFSDAQSMQPAQEWDLAENLQGVLEYQTKYSRFQGVGNLTLHFPDNFGGDTTRLIYIGLKGEATQLKRDVVATIVYEIMPNPSDHKTKAFIHCANFGEITKLIDVYLVDKLNPTDWRRLLAHGILYLGSIYHRCVHYDGCGECPITGPQFKSKGKLVIGEIVESAATPLQAVKLLALYLFSPDNKESTIASLLELLGDQAIGNNPIIRLIAGIIFMHEQDYNEALKHTNVGGTMELHALNVQIFLKMHRSDYAEKQLRIMQQIDEDHTLSQLASAWLNLAVGGSKIQEAYLIFQDFSEKYQMTSLVLNGKAVCCMHMGNFDEAESLLLEALNKDAKDPETLANLIVCSLHIGKTSTRYLNQLKLSHPEHALVKRGTSAEEAFDRALQTIA